MRLAHFIALISLFFITALPTSSAERIVKEFTASDGMLNAVTDNNKVTVISPAFELDPTPLQYIEIEVKTDIDGQAQLYYLDTNKESSPEFKSEQSVQLNIRGDNEYHVYKVYPFWQSNEKVARIRLDITSSSATIRAIRIIDSMPGQAIAPNWTFKNSNAEWQLIKQMGSIQVTPLGLQVNGNADATVLSSLINVAADDNKWATIRVISKTAHTMLLKWACDKSSGLQCVPVELRGDNAIHSYTICLGELPQWQGNIRALAVTPSDCGETRNITIESVVISNASVGPPELEIIKFHTEPAVVRAGQKAKLVVEVKNTGGSDALSIAGIATLWVKDQKISKSDSDADDNQYNSTIILANKRISKLAPGNNAQFEWLIDIRESPMLATCRVSALNLVGEQKSINIQPCPKLNKLEMGAYE